MRTLHLYIALARTLLAAERRSDKVFQKNGLTKTQFAVLEALYHKGDLSQSDIHKLILTTAGNLPVVVRNLLKEQWIRKRTDAHDGRRQILSLTEAGRAKIEAVFPENKEVIEDFFSPLTENEKKTMHALFQKLRKEHDEG